MLRKIAAWASGHAYIVLGIWLVAILCSSWISADLTANLNKDTGKSHKSESEVGKKLIESVKPYNQELLIYMSGAGVSDLVFTRGLTASVDDVRSFKHVGGVSTASNRPSSASIIVVSVENNISIKAADDTIGSIKRRLDRLAQQHPSVKFRYGGEIVVDQEIRRQTEKDTRRAELLSLPASLAALVLVFGGLRAASAPVVGAVASLSGAMLGLYCFQQFVDLDSSVMVVTTILSLGLSIDYGLLIVNRFRQERSRRQNVNSAIEATMASAGRTILFSAVTLASSLAGLFLFDDPFYRAMGAAGFSVVIASGLTAVTLYPAMLATLCRRISPPGARRDTGRFFAKVARLSQRHSRKTAVSVSLILIALGLPFLHVKLQSGSVDLLPRSFESRQVALDVKNVFGQQDEAIVVVTHAGAHRLESLIRNVKTNPLVSAVESPVSQHGVTRVSIIPRGSRQGVEAQEVVRYIRGYDTGFPSWVTGPAAALVDNKEDLERNLPAALAVIMGAATILLFLMTGSVLIPIKALAMNILSLGASLGVLVFGFQDGKLASLLGFESPGAIEVWVPIIVFVFSFGLSMDYEVFLLARIKEARDGGASNDRSVELALQHSGRIITAAASLIMLVFLGFVAGELVSIKELGVALAVAIFIDVTLVRCLLVPSTMHLLGDVNWWCPPGLRTIHRRFGLMERDSAPMVSGCGSANDSVPRVRGRGRHRVSGTLHLDHGPDGRSTYQDVEALGDVQRSVDDSLRQAALFGRVPNDLAFDSWLLVANAVSPSGQSGALVLTDNRSQPSDHLKLRSLLSRTDTAEVRARAEWQE
jgi:RND superfamily putative drug exporter